MCHREHCASRFEGIDALRSLLASVATAPSMLALLGM
jgi:hypothetical protein